MKKLLKKKAIAIPVLILMVLIILSGVFSYISYTVLEIKNPFAAGIGIVRVMYTDTEYVVVQNHPKVVFTKFGYSLENYMESEGYTKTDQMGAMYHFEKDGEEIRIHAPGPGRFGKWYWVYDVVEE